MRLVRAFTAAATVTVLAAAPARPAAPPAGVPAPGHVTVSQVVLSVKKGRALAKKLRKRLSSTHPLRRKLARRLPSSLLVVAGAVQVTPDPGALATFVVTVVLANPVVAAQAVPRYGPVPAATPPESDQQIVADLIVGLVTGNFQSRIFGPEDFEDSEPPPPPEPQPEPEAQEFCRTFLSFRDPPQLVIDSNHDLSLSSDEAFRRAFDAAALLCGEAPPYGSTMTDVEAFIGRFDPSFPPKTTPACGQPGDATCGGICFNPALACGPAFDSCYCLPPTTTTTTTLPTLAFTCPTTGMGCDGFQSTLGTDPRLVTDPPAGADAMETWTVQAPTSCAANSRIPYMIDAGTGRLLRHPMFARAGGATDYTVSIATDGATPGQWSVTFDAHDGGPAGYAGGGTATVYPVVCWY